MRSIFLWLLVLLFSLSLPVFGQNPSKTISPARLERELKEIKKSYPSLFSYRVLVKSPQNRPLYLVHLREKKTSKATPAIFFLAGLRSQSLYSTNIALAFTKKLLSRAKESSSPLKHTAIYLVLRANPDGAKAALEKKRPLPPGNLRPYDEDQDGKVDEDPAEDLNGDGLLSQMLIPSEDGKWKLREKGVGKGVLPVKINPKENFDGQRYHLYREGKDNDKDGKFNEDGPGGISFQSHFPSRWKEEAKQKGAGDYPLSEPETRAIIDFITKTPQILMAIELASYHQKGLYLPYGRKDLKKIKGEDRILYERIVNKAKKIPYLTLKKGVAGERRGKKSFGSFVDWCYHRKGIFSLGISLWGTPEGKELFKWKVPLANKKEKEKKDKSKKKKKFNSLSFDQRRYLLAQKYHPQRGFLSWKKHKIDKREVLIGGFQQDFNLLPPAEIESQLRPLYLKKLYSLLQTMTRHLPSPKFTEIKVIPQGKNTYQIKVKVINQSLFSLPSYRKRKIKEGVRPRLGLVLPPKGKILMGRKEIALPPLKPHHFQKGSWLVYIPQKGPLKIYLRGKRGKLLEREITRY